MTATQPLTAALVGCGRIGAFTREDLAARLGPNWWPLSHAEAIASIDDLVLTACCDVDRAAAQRAADRFGAPRVFDNAGNLLASALPDILSLATRSDVRPGILIAAAESGIRAIHTEKPLGLRLSDCLQACAALAARNVAVSYGALRRYMPVYREAKRIVESGEFGSLQSIIVKFGRTGLMWNHPHSIDLICYFAGCGDVVDMHAICDTGQAACETTRIDGDPTVINAAIRFANGVVGHIVDAGGLTVELYCERGTIAVPSDGAWLELRHHRLGREADPHKDIRVIADQSKVSGRVLAFKELVAALRNGASTTLHIDDLIVQHKILFGLAQSYLQGGRRIRFDAVDPELTVTGRTQGKVA